MSLKRHYHKMFESSADAIAAGSHKIDTLIYDPADTRRGITLLSRPSEEIKHNLLQVTNAFRMIEPSQYFHPASDLHITILSLVSCFETFNLSTVNISSYIEILKPIFLRTQPLKIEIRGITSSPEAIVACGYFERNSLNELRDEIRESINQSGLYHRMDTRYPIRTAHITLMRFARKMEHGKESLELLEKYRDTPFGSYTINEAELVYNDWYQRKSQVKSLHTFTAGNSR